MLSSKKKRSGKKTSEKKKAARSSQDELDEFLDKYTPAIATLARGCLAKMRDRLPGATQLVYDNYNALAIGFSPSERASDVIFSIAIYPRYVRLFFLQGKHVPDPKKLLQGEGNIVRHLRIDLATDLDKPEIQELMIAALKSAKKALDPKALPALIIRSIALKQRPRRPGRDS